MRRQLSTASAAAAAAAGTSAAGSVSSCLVCVMYKMASVQRWMNGWMDGWMDGWTDTVPEDALHNNKLRSTTLSLRRWRCQRPFPSFVCLFVYLPILYH